MEVKTISFVQTIEKNIEMNFNLNDIGGIFCSCNHTKTN